MDINIRTCTFEKINAIYIIPFYCTFFYYFDFYIPKNKWLIFDKIKAHNGNPLILYFEHSNAKSMMTISWILRTILGKWQMKNAVTIPPKTTAKCSSKMRLGLISKLWLYSMGQCRTKNDTPPQEPWGILSFEIPWRFQKTRV